MQIEFDADKNVANIARHGVDMATAADFEWQSAIIEADTRRDYGEPRYKAIGFLNDRLHVLIFTPRAAAVRVISLRKANPREVTFHEKTQT